MASDTMWGRSPGPWWAAILFLGGCGVRVDYLPLNSPPREMRVHLPAEVDFFEGVEPSKPYVEVATIDARQRQASRASKEELFGTIRDSAARHGCDGVKIIGRIDLEGQSGYRAACIVYRDSETVATNSEPLKSAAPPNPYEQKPAKATAPPNPYDGKMSIPTPFAEPVQKPE